MICPTGKVQFATKAAAKKWLRKNRRARGLAAKHAYLCLVCGDYHLTKLTVSAGVEGPCRFCGARVVWTQLLNGALIPLEPAEVIPQRSVCSVIAYDARTGEGTGLRGRSDYSEAHCVGLAERGFTFHVAHFPQCPGARALQRQAA